MKKTLLILSAIFIVAVLYFTLPISPFKKAPIYIAVAGPVNTAQGIEMRKGTELLKDKVNTRGGVSGKKIEFIYYDDKDESETAEKIASEIAGENKVVMVLGHYSNAASFFAGKIYKMNEIPAITASATNEYVTSKNEWFFRVIPNDIMEAKFVANYIAVDMKKTAASIIFTNDSYGMSLAEYFEKELVIMGIKLNNKWEWDTENKTDIQTEKIISELKVKAADDLGILFLATQSTQGIEIITALKNEGKKCPIIGSYAFARSFIAEIKKYPRELSEPGYYSDGIYFVSPYMVDIGGAEANAFKHDFIDKYSETPSVLSACYYDAANAAVLAMKKAGAHDINRIREYRRNIREALESFYNEENSIKGVTGYIWFDRKGNVRRHFAVGIWQNHTALPVFSQYQQVTDIGDTDFTKAVMNGEIIPIDDIVMKNIRLVYTGTENITVIRLDEKKSECTMEFDIWFRYPGNFDDTRIEFVNAVSPIRLGKPFKEETADGVITKRYRVKGTFRYDFDFHAYPFDRQTIPIRFRHAVHTDDELMYLPDIMSLPESTGIKLPGWNIRGTDFYQDTLKKESTLGNPEFFDSPYNISFSRFNTEILIQRKVGVLVSIYFFIVISMLLLLLYLFIFVGSDRIRSRSVIFMSVLVICTVFYLVSTSVLSVDYLTVTDWSFIIVYVLVIISAFTSVYSDKRYMIRKKNMKPGLWVNQDSTHSQ
ncbi:MAG: ABC transporter substrate-binding protein [Desulfobacteraceae bacterium]|nr:ABC transporter substrate-binding protein [Desulfobacteraceae bacterium]